MVYVFEPVNEPYDAEEPMPMRLGFVIKAGGAGPTGWFKDEQKPVPREVMPPNLVVDGYDPMPDFSLERDKGQRVTIRRRCKTSSACGCSG